MTDTTTQLHSTKLEVQELHLHDTVKSPKRLWAGLRLGDILFALFVLVGTSLAFVYYQTDMDGYDKAILIGTAPSLIALAWYWKPLRWLVVTVALVSVFALWLYQHDLARSESVFLLKYFLSSQTAIFWMSVSFLFATVFYWAGLSIKSQTENLQQLASWMVWLGVFFALVATMVRWHESYLIGPDIGHIPVSNLYEVFVLFAWMTALFYLYYEEHYQTKALGAFVMLIVMAAVAFLIWYSVSRGAHEIQPLVPALKSWWMKLHVPANFVGYGTFAIAAMVGVAYLIKERWQGGIMQRVPSLEVLDDVMYKAIALGFAFFTVATILGAFWAAEAWGAYWQWDPKETWALIVWLNYAAWLHMRLMKGLRGSVAAWWAVIGLFITTFAFIGVNMFLSGLHSYGEL